ncbi:MAG TPA: hypothetical protein PLW65_34090, partial [Pseudomonadota bacterium]|nr:hypothetical protein [Pseudomonadota bacterium]
MDHAQLGRLNSLVKGVIGSVLLGLALGGSARAQSNERDELPRDAVFTVQSLPARSPRLAPVTTDPALRLVRPAGTPSPLPDLDASELFPAESFADSAEVPSCSTVASLAERLLGTCLRQGLSATERALTQRLLDSAAQPNRTDAWSRDTESLFQLAQCAGSLGEQRLVAEAALAAAEAQLQSSALPSSTLPASRREHAQRARWLWSYRLAALDFAQGHYL